ncbi:MAG: hypothetical protein J6O17_05290 [Eubacterium sp.]|nr:hypothetical protein [Eubacterium sp.]
MEKYILTNDIIKNHTERMLNLRKFYPFFSILQSGISAPSESGDVAIDMGYITLAVLRYLINENNFNEREVTRPEVRRFLAEILTRDYELTMSKSEMENLTDSIFDKLTNGGKAFEISFFDPADRKTKIIRVRLIEANVHESEVTYSITEEGIEFYLSTKEMKDESRISTDQLLLEKLIKAENYSGGIDVISRINLEVSSLHKKRDEAVALLLSDVHAGTAAVDDFMASTSRWFEEERKSFTKSRELVDKAASRLDRSSNGKAVRDITRLETLLKQAIDNHSRLIKASAELSRFADEMVSRKKMQILRNTFDFEEALSSLEKVDAPDRLAALISPLLTPKCEKSFQISMIDSIVLKKINQDDVTEKVEHQVADLSFRYEDEILSEQTGRNFAMLFRELLERLEKWDKLTLREYNAILEMKFTGDIYKNRDYFAYLVHLSEKDNYSIRGMLEQQETFLEELAVKYMSDTDKERFADIRFRLVFGDEEVAIEESSVTDITFERM